MDRNSSASVEETLPSDLLEVFRANPEAESAWNGLTAIGRRDFLRWIGEAKQAEMCLKIRGNGVAPLQLVFALM